MRIALLIRVDCRRGTSCTLLVSHQTKLQPGFAANAVKSETDTDATHTHTNTQIRKYTYTHRTKVCQDLAGNAVKSETDTLVISILVGNADNMGIWDPYWFSMKTRAAERKDLCSVHSLYVGIKCVGHY